MGSFAVSLRLMMRWSPVIAALLLASVLGTLGCRRKSASDREIVAEVDGQPISKDLLERVYRGRAAQSSDPTDPQQVLSLKLSILNELINNQILVAHASRSRIEVSEAEVDTKIAELQSPYSKEEFQKRLKDQNMEMGDLRQDVRESLIIDKLINKEILSRITVSDEEIAQYYEHNKSAFNYPETEYHLAQILVTPFSDPEVRNLKNDDAKTPVAAERKVEALYARVKSGEDFARVASEYSEDPRTASGGGDMGFIPSSAFDSAPALKKAVNSLQVGQISPIIRAEGGYHILKLLGREDAGQRLLGNPEVQSSIRQTIANEKEQLLKQAYIEVLRDRAKVKNYLAEQVSEGAAQPPSR
jgi:peptidyl-prolyl cis-trans isomerase SurA